MVERTAVASFDGIVIANEVLDAMPVHILQKQGDWMELGVAYDGQELYLAILCTRQDRADRDPVHRSVDWKAGEFPTITVVN